MGNKLLGTICAVVGSTVCVGSAFAQGGGQNLQAILEGAEIPVTVDRPQTRGKS